MNDCNFLGRLTKDPELRLTTSGKKCLNFCIAVRRKFKNDTSDFIDCVAWDKTAEVIIQYCKKGDLIGVTGQLQTRFYETASGEKRKISEIIVSDFDFTSSKSSSAPVEKTPELTEQPEIVLDQAETPAELPFEI